MVVNIVDDAITVGSFKCRVVPVLDVSRLEKSFTPRSFVIFVLARNSHSNEAGIKCCTEVPGERVERSQSNQRRNMPTIKGTASVADSRALQKSLKRTKFPANFNEPVELSKINRTVLMPWIEKKITELLGFEDEIVASTAINLFLPSPPPPDSSLPPPTVDPKQAQIDITGFLGDEQGPRFAAELWELMLDAQTAPMGIPRKLVEEKKRELAATSKSSATTSTASLQPASSRKQSYNNNYNNSNHQPSHPNSFPRGAPRSNAPPAPDRGTRSDRRQLPPPPGRSYHDYNHRPLPPPPRSAAGMTRPVSPPPTQYANAMGNGDSGMDRQRRDDGYARNDWGRRERDYYNSFSNSSGGRGMNGARGARINDARGGAYPGPPSVDMDEFGRPLRRDGKDGANPTNPPMLFEIDRRGNEGNPGERNRRLRNDRDYYNDKNRPPPPPPPPARRGEGERGRDDNYDHRYRGRDRDYDRRPPQRRYEDDDDHDDARRDRSRPSSRRRSRSLSRSRSRSASRTRENSSPSDQSERREGRRGRQQHRRRNSRSSSYSSRDSSSRSRSSGSSRSRRTDSETSSLESARSRSENR